MATSIGKLSVQLGVDPTGLKRGLATGKSDISAFAKQTQTEMNNLAASTGRAAGGRFGEQLAKGARGLSFGLDNLANIKDTQSAIAAVQSTAGATLASFGPLGAAAAAGISLVAVGIAGLSNLFKDELQEKAKKSFESVIDGSKSASVALAEIRVETIHEEFKGMVESLQRMNTMRDTFPVLAVALEHSGMHAEMLASQLDHVANRAMRAQQNLQALISSEAGQQMLRVAAAARAERDLGRMEEELRLRRETFGMSEREIAIERMRRQLMEGSGIFGAVVGNLRLNAVADESRRQDRANSILQLQRQAQVAGMSAEAIQLRELKLQGATDTELRYVQALQQHIRTAQATADVGRFIEDLAFRRDTVGLSSDEIRLRQLAAAGADAAQIDSARQLISLLEEEQRRYQAVTQSIREMQSFAEQITQATRTPLERFALQMERLEEALAHDLIDWETFERGAAQAADELNRVVDAAHTGFDFGDIKAPEAVLQGSAEAIRAVNATVRGEEGSRGPMDRIQALLEQDRRDQQRIASSAERAARVLEALEVD